MGKEIYVIDMFNDIIKTEAQQIFVKDIVSILDNKNEITMSYKDIEFVVDPHGNNIEIYSNGKTIAFYSDSNDFLLNHKIDGKAIMELYADIDYTI